MNGPFRPDPDEPNPLTSTGRQAERDAFDARGRAIWVGIVLAVVLAAFGAWWMFR